MRRKGARGSREGRQDRKQATERMDRKAGIPVCRHTDQQTYSHAQVGRDRQTHTQREREREREGEKERDVFRSPPLISCV